MFNRFLMLAVAVSAFLFTGCAAVHQNTSAVDPEHHTTLAEEFDKIQMPFSVVYGKHGHQISFKRSAGLNSMEGLEELANFMIVLQEPGFVVLMSDEAKAEGLAIQLEKLFREEKFQMMDIKKHEITKSKVFWQLNFVKCGEIVLFK